MSSWDGIAKYSARFRKFIHGRLLPTSYIPELGCLTPQKSIRSTVDREPAAPIRLRCNNRQTARRLAVERALVCFRSMVGTLSGIHGSSRTAKLAYTEKINRQLMGTSAESWVGKFLQTVPILLTACRNPLQPNNHQQQLNAFQ